jgi:hypothetical protein
MEYWTQNRHTVPRYNRWAINKIQNVNFTGIVSCKWKVSNKFYNWCMFSVFQSTATVSKGSKKSKPFLGWSLWACSAPEDWPQEQTRREDDKCHAFPAVQHVKSTNPVNLQNCKLSSDSVQNLYCILPGTWIVFKNCKFNNCHNYGYWRVVRTKLTWKQ